MTTEPNRCHSGPLQRSKQCHPSKVNDNCIIVNDTLTRKATKDDQLQSIVNKKNQNIGGVASSTPSIVTKSISTNPRSVPIDTTTINPTTITTLSATFRLPVILHDNDDGNKNTIVAPIVEDTVDLSKANKGERPSDVNNCESPFLVSYNSSTNTNTMDHKFDFLLRPQTRLSKDNNNNVSNSHMDTNIHIPFTQGQPFISSERERERRSKSRNRRVEPDNLFTVNHGDDSPNILAIRAKWNREAISLRDSGNSGRGPHSSPDLSSYHVHLPRTPTKVRRQTGYEDLSSPSPRTPGSVLNHWKFNCMMNQRSLKPPKLPDSDEEGEEEVGKGKEKDNERLKEDFDLEEKKSCSVSEGLVTPKRKQRSKGWQNFDLTSSPTFRNTFFRASDYENLNRMGPQGTKRRRTIDQDDESSQVLGHQQGSDEIGEEAEVSVGEEVVEIEAVEEEAVEEEAIGEEVVKEEEEEKRETDEYRIDQYQGPNTTTTTNNKLLSLDLKLVDRFLSASVHEQNLTQSQFHTPPRKNIYTDPSTIKPPRHPSIGSGLPMYCPNAVSESPCKRQQKNAFLLAHHP